MNEIIEMLEDICESKENISKHLKDVSCEIESCILALILCKTKMQISKMFVSLFRIFTRKQVDSPILSINRQIHLFLDENTEKKIFLQTWHFGFDTLQNQNVKYQKVCS
jgi:hypothetical protein